MLANSCETFKNRVRLDVSCLFVMDGICLGEEQGRRNHGDKGGGCPLPFLARGQGGQKCLSFQNLKKNLTSFIKKLDGKPVL